MTFNPKAVSTFYFDSCSFDEATGEAVFQYHFDTGEQFTEILTFPKVYDQLTVEKKEALNHALHFLHLMLGVSYFKAAIPEKIIINNFKLSKEHADFYNKIYLNGLGEFAYRNDLNLSGKVRFPYVDNQQSKPNEIQLKHITAVPLGGGKDSIVTMCALQEVKEPIKLITLGDFAITQQVASYSGLEHIVIHRKIAPKLLEINQQGALNGHVPISAMIAFILVVAGILYDFDAAALSNERSANVGNVVQDDGLEVNHQYSKSFAFEKDVSNFIKRHVLKNFLYFSFLRPLADLHIAKLFSQCDEYHSIFTSCNSAFKLRKGQRVARWCLDCPKCRFTFLALAPFIQKKRLIEIFGKNLLNDEAQTEGYQELLGVSGHKPFECVGEIEESLAAFFLLVQKSEWRDDLLVKYFKENVLPKIDCPNHLVNTAFHISKEHLLPKKFEAVLNRKIS